MNRLQTLLWLAYHAASEQLPMAAHYWLCQALGEANQTSKARVPQIMRALCLIRRHPGYRELV